MRRGGFSIAELLVAVAVVAILGMIVVARRTPVVEQATLELAAEEVASALRFARSEAMRTAEPHGVRIDLAEQRVRVYRLDTRGSPPSEHMDVYNPVDRRLYDVRVASGSLRRGGGIASVSFRFSGDPVPRESVAFDARGLPRSPLDLAPLESAQVEVGAGDRTSRIVVYAHSGQVALR